jgi:hypothetical protein
MNCAYHVQNNAVVSCSGCGKPLCPACDHRIKGFPYCQDCIVSGVQLLQQRSQQVSFVPTVKKQSSPFLATILSFFCPGLGAAYNGQTSKALIYFGVFVGLIQMAILTGGMPIFVFGFIGMWLFAALDAWRTAQSIRAGVSVDKAEDILVQRLSGSPKIWGIVLTLLGVLSFFYMLGFRLPLRGILPLLLIGFGVYLLREFFFNKKEETSAFDFENQLGSSPNNSGLYETSFRTGEFVSFDEYKTRNEARKWNG